MAAVITQPGEASTYTAHAPIEIFNDENFTAANGVTGGSGTYEDPYVFSGWEIDLSSETDTGENQILAGIEIQNTESHFLIENVYIHSGNQNNANDQYGGALGMLFYNVAGVWIEDSRFSNNSIGMSIDYSAGIQISGCEISDNAVGILTDYLQGSIITENIISRNTDRGVELYNAWHCSLTDNTITGSDLFGANLYMAEECVVSGNSIIGNLNGLNVGFSKEVTVTNNTIADNENFGMMVYGCTDMTIEDNSISNNKVQIEGEDDRNWLSVIAVLAVLAIVFVVILLIMLRPKKGSPEVSSVPTPPST